MNNEEHCFDGGDCSRNEVKSSKCNDRSCCTQATAIAEICNTCNCNQIDGTICKGCCLNGFGSNGTNGIDPVKVTYSVQTIIVFHISSAFFNLFRILSDSTYQ